MFGYTYTAPTPAPPSPRDLYRVGRKSAAYSAAYRAAVPTNRARSAPRDAACKRSTPAWHALTDPALAPPQPEQARLNADARRSAGCPRMSGQSPFSYIPSYPRAFAFPLPVAPTSPAPPQRHTTLPRGQPFLPSAPTRHASPSTPGSAPWHRPAEIPATTRTPRAPSDCRAGATLPLPAPHPEANPPGRQPAPAPHRRSPTAKRISSAATPAPREPPAAYLRSGRPRPVTPRLSNTTARRNALRPENRPGLTSAATRDGHHPPVPGRPRQPGIPASANPHPPAATPYALTNRALPRRISTLFALHLPARHPRPPRPNPVATHPQPPRQATADCDSPGGGWSKPTGWPI